MIRYPFHDRTLTVTQCGRICLAQRRKINLGTVLAGQHVGIKQVDEHVWLVTFMHYDPGFFDDETCRLEPAKNRSRRLCYRCLRYKPSPGDGIHRYEGVASQGFEPRTNGL